MHPYTVLGELSKPSRPFTISLLAGDWACAGLMAQYGGPEPQPWQAVLRIETAENLLSITMILADGRIGFYSQSGAVELIETGVIRLKYLYSNLADANPRTKNAYFGHADLLFSPDFTKASGKYFNDEQRMTFGTFELSK